GSGFLIRAEKSTGLVATNYHVIAAAATPKLGERPTVSVIFDSGLATQAEYPAEIVAAEPVVDLAVLRITGASRLHTPIDPGLAEAPAETTAVLICGFPLGDLFASGGRSPSIT